MVTSVQKTEQVKRAAVFNCVLQNTGLNKGHGFLTFKKVEIIEKADARAHTTDFKWQFNPSDLFQA